MATQLNFAQQMDAVLKTLGNARPRLLLHACCGPCSSAVLEQLCQYFEITVLYYNPNGGSYYHRADTCYSVTKDNVTFESFTYAQLDEEPYSKLDFCPYCAPAMRKADIEAINAQYVFGGDHDPILTAARQPYFDYIASLDPPEATETPAP